MAGDFDRAATMPVERVARTLAAHALSRNGEGDMASAAEAVDALWPDHTAVSYTHLTLPTTERV